MLTATGSRLLLLGDERQLPLEFCGREFVFIRFVGLAMAEKCTSTFVFLLRQASKVMSFS